MSMMLYKLVAFFISKLALHKLNFLIIYNNPIFHHDVTLSLYLKLILHNKSSVVHKVMKFWINNYKEIDSRINYFEMASILQSIVDTKDVDGNIIELGAYHAGTTILMVKTLQELDITDKKIYACDTYSGFPYAEDISPNSKLQDFSDNDQNIIREKLKKFGVSNYVELVVGKFEDTLHAISSDRKYVIAFVDCDLYKSAKVALDYLKNTMTEKSLIFIHDYALHEEWGIYHAVNEFDYNEDKIKIITNF